MTIECKVGGLYAIKEVIFQCYLADGEHMACRIIKPADGSSHHGSWTFHDQRGTYFFEGRLLVGHSMVRGGNSAYHYGWRSNSGTQIDRVIEP